MQQQIARIGFRACALLVLVTGLWLMAQLDGARQLGPGTNPEELIGAAHSGCYSMFLAALISGEKFNPESVETTASVHLGKDDKGPLITTIELDCQVKCEGLSQEKFEELAAAAKAGCPISRLVAAADIKLNATLL